MRRRAQQDRCNGRMRGTSGGPGVRFGQNLPRGDGAVRPKATTRHGVWAAGVGRGIARGCWFWIALTGRANQLTGRAGSSAQHMPDGPAGYAGVAGLR